MNEAMSDTQSLLKAAAIVVHELAHVETALAAAARAGRAVVLLSPRGASAYMGAGYFRAMIETGRRMHPAAEAVAVLDCGDRAGDAMGALREGIEVVCFRGDPAVATKLAEMAAQSGAAVIEARPEAFDLAGVDDAANACRTWLNK